MQLENTFWQLVRFQPSGEKMRAALNDEARLHFSVDNTISGHTGCNAMGGEYELKDDQLTIQAFFTKRYCAQVAAMENAENQIMAQPMTVVRQGDELILRAGGGQLVYTQTKPPKTAAKQPATYEEGNSTEPQPVIAAATSRSTPKTISDEMTGLFRYLADAAVFQDCANGQRYAVAIDDNFRLLEAPYQQLNKSGEAALVTLEGIITPNTGEGLAKVIAVLRVSSMSPESECK